MGFLVVDVGQELRGGKVNFVMDLASVEPEVGRWSHELLNLFEVDVEIKVHDLVDEEGRSAAPEARGAADELLHAALWTADGEVVVHRVAPIAVLNDVSRDHIALTKPNDVDIGFAEHWMTLND